MHLISMVWWHLLVIGVVLRTATPEVTDATTLQQLGLLLGLPVDREESSLENEQVPQFVEDVYNCWNTNSKDRDCLPGYHGNDVNFLRTSLGIENQTPSQAVHSYNIERELKNSLEISFNISLTPDQDEIIHYAMLRLYRQPLSFDQIAALQHRCSNLSSLTLQLYTQASTESSTPVFSVRSVQSLSEIDLTRGKWVEFLNLTRVYKSMIEPMYKKLSEEITDQVLHLRLTVGGPCSDLSPSDLGFISVLEYKAQLIGLTENLIQKNLPFSRVMSLIAKEQSRAKRQADEVQLGSGQPLVETEESRLETLDFTEASNESNIVTFTENDQPPTEPTNEPPRMHYNSLRCTFFRYYISFRSLGWKSVILPLGYYANFCAGRCEYPPRSSEAGNVHAYIQLLANFGNENRIPPPSCVPNPEKLGTLSVTLRDRGGYSVRIYNDMVANSCVCL